MASGWWRSTYTNLEDATPADFTVDAAPPQSPRGFPKLASIATGAGLFLGGNPCASTSDAIYYPGDSYTQDTNNPPLMRWDGRINSTLLEVPPVVATPAKAILSIVVSTDGCVYYSTWDSGTTKTTFAGRVYEYDVSTGVSTQLGTGLFTAGRLPYALSILGDDLYVGVNNQNPDQPGLVYIINMDTHTVAYAQDTSTSTTYKVTSVQRGTSTESGPSNTVTVTSAVTLDADIYNTVSWPAPSVVAYAPQSAPTVANSTTAGGFRKGFDYYFRYAYSTATSANSVTEVTESSPFSTVLNLVLEFKCVDVTVNYSTDPNVKWIIVSWTNTGTSSSEAYLDYGSSNASIIANNSGGGSTTMTVSVNNGGTLVNPFPTTNVSVSTPVSYKVYRTAGHSSTGKIATTSSLSFVDDGDAGDASSPPAANAITAPVIAVAKHNPKKFSGGVGCLTAYSSNMYAGLYQVSGTFATVQQITPAGVVSTSNTIAPGGSAGSYNGFTAGVVFESNLYMGYWNDDATDIALIRKYTGSVWSTVSTVSGANARPIMAMLAQASFVYAYAGGDGVTGLFYTSVDGTTWVDNTALLPSVKEGIPFMGTVAVIGGF